MSRIHEALKRAEQERRASQRPLAKEQEQMLSIINDPLRVEEIASVAAASAKVTPAPAGKGADTQAAEPAPLPRAEETVAEPASLSLAQVSVRCSRPAWKPNRERMLFLDHGEHSGPVAEEFRTLRARLYRMREKRPLRSILVTSPLPGDGKSFLAGNLSQILARQHGRPTLLIDGDLRWSRLHQYLGAPWAPGLTELLQGAADEYSTIQHSPMENLFFLPGGKPPHDPAELIGDGSKMKALLERLAQVFEWIIVDSPPVVPVSDAAVLAQACDGILLVVRSAQTPYEAAQRAREEMKERPLLGVVLNGVNLNSSYVARRYETYYDRYEKGHNELSKE
jgi:capsular exopolysaccharide synthesis family protein